MSNTDSLFSAFNPVSQKDWEAKAIKDLKGKALEDLNWHIQSWGTLQPYYALETNKTSTPLPLPKHPYGWGVAERIDCTDVKGANTQLLEALQQGVNVPILEINHKIDRSELRQLFEGVEPTYIKPHFQIPPNKLKRAMRIVETYHNQMVEEGGWNPEDLRGTISIDPLNEGVDFAKLGDLLKNASELLPNFSFLSVQEKNDPEDPQEMPHELARLLAKISEYITYLKLNRIQPQTIIHHMTVELHVGTSYLLEIAKLRAFRLLWGNLLKGFGMNPLQPLKLLVHTSQEDFVEDANQNMIRSTTMAMSAALGGATAIHILPSDVRTGQSTDFSRRIARNIHHLLTMESHLHHVVDPTAGSYYIEQATHMLAEQAWKLFQGIEQNGGYLEM